MHSFILQDWTVIAGPNSATAPVTQEDAFWLDLAPFQDVVIYLDVREATGAPTIAFETSPVKDNSVFQTLVSTALTASSSPTVLRGLMLGSSVPHSAGRPRCDEFAKVHGCASGYAHLDTFLCTLADAGTTGHSCDMVGCSSTQDTPCPPLP